MANGNMSFTFSERELQKLYEILEEISMVDRNKVIINALRSGTQKIVSGGKKNLASRNNTNRPKKKGGHLIKSFKTSSSKKKVVAYAGFSRTGLNKGNHAHLVDRGTVKRWTKKGKYTGSVSRGNPQTGTMFWTDSVMAQGPKTMDNLRSTIYRELLKITSRR